MSAKPNTSLNERTKRSSATFMVSVSVPSMSNMTRRMGKRPNENKMSDGGRERTSLGVEVWKSSQKWSVRRSAVRSIAWLGLCGFIGGRGATIGAQLHNKFFAIIAIAHILSCKLESAFL